MSFFFCVLTKKELRVRIYHTSQRFYVWVTPPYPERLVLTPGEGTRGRSTQWTGGSSFSLEAPILDITIPEFEDDRGECRERAAETRMMSSRM